uniref:Uncharacterized protein n=1 Tax=Malurus cyaneus samueli TaxID=2593467 RepID=A0A8C5X063_9PASS
VPWGAWASNHSSGGPALPTLLHSLTEQKKALRFNNYSNPALELQEEIMASFYILVIVGFFGFLLFVMMLSNIVSSKPENYMDYLYSGKVGPVRGTVELPPKEPTDTFIIINSSALLELQGREGKASPGAQGVGTSSPLRDV